MKRLLVISYYWPPTGGSGVQRWVKFCKYLPSMGWQPVVYTPENPEQLARDESLLNDVPECVEVLKTPIREPYGIYRRLSGRKKEGGVNPLNASKKSWKQKIAVWLRGNLFVPDPRVGWVRPSVKFLSEYLKEHPVDAIVTTGPPQSMHLIGLGLKKATGVRWIVDFRDPWTEMFYFKHMGLWPLAERRHRRLEQQVLDSCDAVIAVTPRVQADFQAKTSTPVHLLTNGFDEEDFQKMVEVPEDGKFRIVHTGLFASDGNPLNLWKVLSDECRADAAFASRLEIRLAGKVDAEIVEAIRAAGLEGNLRLLGYLSHDDTVREQKQASILMLPLRQEPEYAKVYPGKIFEYLAARRPVLGIGQSDGAAAELLRSEGAGQMFGWQEYEPLRSFVKSVLDASADYGHGDIDRFTRRRLTEALTELL